MAEFERIFEQNRDFVFKYLLKLCRNISLAEELTQETFFRAYMNFASIRNKERCASWLCQTAKNAYFAWYNQNKRMVALDEGAELDGGDDHESELIEAELKREAENCLAELDEPYGSVFKLFVLSEVSLKEISRLYGKSESWARVTYYRAKQKLIERMKKNEM